MGTEGICLVAAGGDDPLAGAVCRELAARGADVVRWPLERLGGLALTVGPETASSQGRPIAGALFLGQPGGGFGDGFADDDRGFVDHEVRATWSALLALPGMWTANRPDVDFWFARAEWPVWRRLLADAAVPLAPLAAGEPAGDEAGWLPYCGGPVGPLPPPGVGAWLGASYALAPERARSVWCCGERIEAAGDPDDEALAAALAAAGCRLFAATFDAGGRVVRLTVFPELTEPRSAARAGRLLAEDYHAHRPGR